MLMLILLRIMMLMMLLSLMMLLLLLQLFLSLMLWPAHDLHANKPLAKQG